MGRKIAVTRKAVFASVRHIICIEIRARRLLCDTKIKYSPLRMCSGKDDKPSLNPSGEKHREQTVCTSLDFSIEVSLQWREAFGSNMNILKTSVFGAGFTLTCFSNRQLDCRDTARAMYICLESRDINVCVSDANSCTQSDVDAFLVSQPEKHIFVYPGYIFVVEKMPIFSSFFKIFMSGVVFIGCNEMEIL